MERNEYKSICDIKKNWEADDLYMQPAQHWCCGSCLCQIFTVKIDYKRYPFIEFPDEGSGEIAHAKNYQKELFEWLADTIISFLIENMSTM